jgi:HEAT repeat protein
LIEAFANEDSNLAASIQYVLEQIGVPAILPLIRSLGHGNRLVRSRAAATLGLMGDQKAVSSLLSLLSTEKDPEVIVSVVQALGQLSDPRAIRALQDIARNSNIDFLKEEARMAIQKLLTKKV